MNANIVKTQIFHEMKYVIQGHKRQPFFKKAFFLSFSFYKDNITLYKDYISLAYNTTYY